MSPTDQINSLFQRVQALEDALNQLGSSSAIPSEVQDAFTERLEISALLKSTGTGSAGSTTSFSGFPVIIPANPSGTLTVTYNGTTYNLLCK